MKTILITLILISGNCALLLDKPEEGASTNLMILALLSTPEKAAPLGYTGSCVNISNTTCVDYIGWSSQKMASDCGVVETQTCSQWLGGVQTWTCTKTNRGVKSVGNTGTTVIYFPKTWSISNAQSVCQSYGGVFN